MLNKLFILVILSVLSIIIIKVYYYFKKVEEFNNLVNGKYGKICRKSNTIREVYSCGWNNKGQLGFDSKKYGMVPQTIPISIPNISNITQIACGNEHSLFLTSNNRVYSCGWNNKGQLGLNLDSTKIRTPQLIENYYVNKIYYYDSINYDEITINKIACGGKHSLFLTNDGHVYSCGSNFFGQLGLNLYSFKLRRPQLIENYYDSDYNIINYDAIKIKQIAGGQVHSLFLTSNNYVYSCGRNYSGQLGLNSTNDAKTPQLIENYYYDDSNSINYDEITITQIACGLYHNLFLTNQGHVYSCGKNNKGQLGLNLDSTKIRRPRLIENYYNVYNSINYDAIKIKQIAGGNEHSLFLTSNNYVYSCGLNASGQLGLNSTKDEKTPQLIVNYYVNNKYYYYNAITITQIACGAYHSLFLTNEGHVYSCGSNFFGQLGLDSVDNEKKPKLIKKYYDSNSNSINYNEIMINQIAGGGHSTFINTIRQTFIVS